MKWIFLIILLAFVIPPAFATEPSPHPIVGIHSGIGIPGCFEKSCFLPYESVIRVGEKVIWTNDDIVAHMIASEPYGDIPNDVFYSGLFLPGTTFTHTYEEAGVFPYFCTVHPWMKGTIVVEKPIDKDEQIQILTIEVENLRMENYQLKLEVKKLENELDYVEDYVLEVIEDIYDLLREK